jgi:hypothetical protein
MFRILFASLRPGAFALKSSRQHAAARSGRERVSRKSCVRCHRGLSSRHNIFKRRGVTKRFQKLALLLVLALAGHARAADGGEKANLSALPTITGTVRDLSGAPVAGALVSFYHGHYPKAPGYVEVTTDKNGRYAMTMREHPRVIFTGEINLTNIIMARSFERNLASMQEFVAMPTKMDFKLQPGITLVGSVKDTEGAPVANALADLRITSSGSIPKSDPPPTKADAQGSFSFAALPQGREYYFLITANGYGTAYAHVKAGDTATNRYEFPALVLKQADRKLAGRVSGPDGMPLAGATVSFDGNGQPQRSTATSDNKGYFVFDEACEGEVHLSASWSGPSENGGARTSLNTGSGITIKAQAGDTNIVLQLLGRKVPPIGVPRDFDNGLR